jgi:hypothetical protein
MVEIISLNPSKNIVVNGMVERMNRTIVEKVRSMLSNPYFSMYFWAEVVHIAFLLTNLSPTTSLDDGIH